MNIDLTSSQVVWGAFLLAFLFGAIAHHSRFCTMGAVSDIVSMQDWSRMRMWLLAIAIAIMGTNTLSLLGVIDLSESIYTSPKLVWLSNMIGGLIFGIGMTLGSGCVHRGLIRIGGGNLKSLVVFVFLAISAYMTLKGLFALARVSYLDPVAITVLATQDFPGLAAGLLGGEIKILQLIFSAVIAAALLVFIFAHRGFRNNGRYIIGGITIGLIIAAGWYVSGKIGYIAEDPTTLQPAFIATNSGKMESFSFVAPIAYTLEWLMLWSDTSKVITFGIAGVLGVIAGSFAYAIGTKSFRLESFRDAKDVINHMLGGIFMGFGGVTALGCTIGHGITGVSTLALGSFIALVSMIVGCALTVRYQYWRMMREP